MGFGHGPTIVMDSDVGSLGLGREVPRRSSREGGGSAVRQVLALNAARLLALGQEGTICNRDGVSVPMGGEGERVKLRGDTARQGLVTWASRVTGI